MVTLIHSSIIDFFVVADLMAAPGGDLKATNEAAPMQEMTFLVIVWVSAADPLGDTGLADIFQTNELPYIISITINFIGVFFSECSIVILSLFI